MVPRDGKREHRGFPLRREDRPYRRVIHTLIDVCLRVDADPALKGGLILSGVVPQASQPTPGGTESFGELFRQPRNFIQVVLQFVPFFQWPSCPAVSVVFHSSSSLLQPSGRGVHGA